MSLETNICYNCFCEHEESEGACPNCGYDPAWGMAKYPLALPHGHVLCDKYILGRVLGQGGYGITYLAMDKWLGTKVAVKEYFPEIGATRTSNTCYVTASSVQKQEEYEKGKADFLQEARVLAAFSGNPNIVKIHGYFEENGTGYFAMDYIEGISFQKYVLNQGGKIPWKDAYDKLLPIIKALEEVHKKGIIHRDISLDNIYITSDGVVKLLDFGAARNQSLNESHSLDVVLKHGYAPFEQYNRRGKQGPFTDVYAVCACFYVAVSGVFPPDATERVEEDRIERLTAIGVDVPQAVEEVILKGLEVKSKDRYQTMEELYEALIHAVSDDIPVVASVVEKQEQAKEEKQDVPPVSVSNKDVTSNVSVNDNTNVKEEIPKKQSIFENVKALSLKKKQMIAAVCGIVLLLCFGVFWFAHPHSYGEWYTVKEVACLEDGIQERKCFCGKKQTEPLVATGHKEVIDGAINPTCSSTGLTAGSHCANCGVILVEQQVIQPTEHNMGYLAAVPPTCTEVGLTEAYGCISCGYTEVLRGTIDPLGHVETSVAEVAPTCATEGRTESIGCSVCGAILVEGQAIPKVAHTPVTDAPVAPTCAVEGKTEGSHCLVCNEVLVKQNSVAKTNNHTPVTDSGYAATCANEGKTEGSHCSVCNTILKKQETIPKTNNHNAVTDSGYAATCASAGKTDGSHCSVCGTVLTKQETIPKTNNHTPVTDAGVAATCTSEGKTEGSHCSVCGVVIKAQDTIGKTEHTAVTDAYVKPTCTTDGLSEGSHCSVCGKVIKEQSVISKSGHSFSGSANNCSYCGAARWYADFSRSVISPSSVSVACTVYSNKSSNEYAKMSYGWFDANGNSLFQSNYERKSGSTMYHDFRSGNYNVPSGATVTFKVFCGEYGTSRTVIGEYTFTVP